MNCSSHTLVKNGMPFIGQVLRQVEPFMDKMFLTLSEKCSDGTEEELMRLGFGEKLEVELENVGMPGDLTQERQKQLNKTKTDWVLFLDDDDYWPTEQLRKMEEYLQADVDAYAVNPYQLVDGDHYDPTWSNKWFTKWFRKQAGVHYRYPWPKDLIFKGDELLYWKINPRVPRIPPYYFHLSYLKNWSFRKEKGFEYYAQEVKGRKELPKDARRGLGIYK